MSKKFTHENVPQEIAKKFPALQAKKIVTKDQVPAHVLESATKNSPAATVPAPSAGTANTAESTAPANVVIKQAVVVAKPTVVHHAPAAHVVQKHAVVAAKPVVVVQQPVVVATKPVVVNKTVKPLTDSKAVAGSAHKQGTAATFTHENVPADIHKKFPTLKGKVQPKAAENTNAQEQGKPESS